MSRNLAVHTLVAVLLVPSTAAAQLPRGHSQQHMVASVVTSLAVHKVAGEPWATLSATIFVPLAVESFQALQNETNYPKDIAADWADWGVAVPLWSLRSRPWYVTLALTAGWYGLWTATRPWQGDQWWRYQ